MFNIYANGQSIYFPLEDDMTIHSPKITLEMGKAGSFQFNIPPTNRYYNRLQKMKTIITVEYDGTEIFRGRVLKNNRGFNKLRQIYCEGDLAYLVDSVQKGEKYTGTTHDLFRRIIANHNARVEAEKQFTVGNITIENREIFIAGTSDEIEDLETGKFNYQQIALNSMVDDWSTSFDYIQNTIIDYCGGYLRTRRSGNVTYIDLLKDYGNTSIQKIEFGTNLIDLNEEVKAEDVYTVLIPLGDDNLTIASVNNGSDELVDTAGVELYGRIVKTNVFDNVNNPNTLLENGRRMLASHENMPITITVKAVDMHLVDNSAGKILIGDKVMVNSIPHDISDYLVCTKIEYDLDNHANDTYTFGNPKQTMTERYRKDKAKQSKSSKSHGSRGGGGGAAAAVEDAEDFAISNSQKTADEFFDAWIAVDKAAGKITLGGVYEKALKDSETLKRSFGIDLDAPTGTVDIYAMNETLNKHGVSIGQNKADIKLVANDLESQVALTATWQRNNIDALAGLTIRANNNESSITSLTTYINKNKPNIESITSVKQKSDANSASIDSLVRYKNKYDSDISGIANIRQKVDKQGSEISTLSSFKTSATTAISSIQQKQTDTESSIKILNMFANDTSIAVNSLTQFADSTKSEIRTFSSFMSDTSLSLTRITQTADKDRSVIEQNVQHISDQGTSIASIKLIAEDNRSSIELKADKIILDGVIDRVKAIEGKFKTLESDFSFAGILRVYGPLFANSSIQVGGEVNLYNGGTLKAGLIQMDGKKVATQEWVKEQLKSYASSSHTHGVYFYHTHKFKIDKTTYETEGARRSSKNLTSVTTGGPN